MLKQLSTFEIVAGEFSNETEGWQYVDKRCGYFWKKNKFHGQNKLGKKKISCKKFSFSSIF